jgi:hypothetical protein
MVTPEDVCCFEATQEGVDRLHMAGITAQLVVTATPAQLASAITQLPADPLYAQVSLARKGSDLGHVRCAALISSMLKKNGGCQLDRQLVRCPRGTSSWG